MPGAVPRIYLRPATRADIPALVEAAESSTAEGEADGFGAPAGASPWESVQRLSEAWKDPNTVRGEEVLVAETGGRVVAYVTVEPRGDALELINIDVAGAHQRRGIGTRLVRFVEERARLDGKRAVTLGTSRNAAGMPWKSLPWWQSLGYRVTGEEENAWTRSIGLGAREIRMRKDLPASTDVVLREPTEGDLAVFFEQQRDPSANAMAAFTRKDPDDREAFIAHWAKILSDGSVRVRTILFDGRVAGSVLSYVESGRTEVSYWIGKEFWGQGVATKALARFVAGIPTRPLHARVAKDNVASIRVLEKCGFIAIGEDKGPSSARGAEVEEYVFVLSANGR